MVRDGQLEIGNLELEGLLGVHDFILERKSQVRLRIQVESKRQKTNIDLKVWVGHASPLLQLLLEARSGPQRVLELERPNLGPVGLGDRIISLELISDLSKSLRASLHGSDVELDGNLLEGDRVQL